MIPYGRQNITQEDIDAVMEVLRSDFLTQGPTTPRFENSILSRTGASHAIAVNSATSALHIACMALQLSPGDRMWTVPNTFVASANCGRYCGADVDFVDIDPNTWNICIHKLGEKLALAKKNQRLPKVVVPVHFAGQPTEQEALHGLAKEFNFRIIEDASHSIGASRNGEPVGSCRWSDITIFSFHPVKVITTCEGGMLLTNDRELAVRMMMLRSHGITRDQNYFVQPSAPPWHYEQQMLGYNYRLTDLQAALGISQLRRLDEFVAKRNQLARRYDVELGELQLQLPFIQQGNYSAFHLYVVRLKKGTSKKAHRTVFEELRSRGIGVNVHYMPIHLQPYYRRLGFKLGQFPESEAHGDQAITLPLYPGLTHEQQDMVVSALKEVL